MQTSSKRLRAGGRADSSGSKGILSAGAEATDSCECGSPGWRGAVGAGKKRL